MTSQTPSLADNLIEKMKESLGDEASVFLIKRIETKIKKSGENPEEQKKTAAEIRKLVNLFVNPRLAELVYQKMISHLDSP